MEREYFCHFLLCLTYLTCEILWVSDTTSQIVYVSLETSKRNVRDSWMTKVQSYPQIVGEI